MLNQLSFLRQALILSLPLGLVACSSGSSNVSQEAPEQLITKNGSQIAIQYGGYITSLARGVDTKKTKMLRVIDRGHNAKAVAGDVASTIFCNPVSLFNIIGACRAKIYTHNREDLQGDDTTIENLVKTYAYPKYKALLQEKLSFDKAGDFTKIPVYFIPGQNYLVYGDNDDYKLRVGFSVYIKYSRVDGMFTCNEEKSGIPLAQWQANNYELAAKESQALLDRCFQRLDQEHFNKVSKHLQESEKEFL